MSSIFQRVSFEDWQSAITLAAFILSFGAFLFLTFRALRMRKSKREHAANLPLESED